jgi:hypothetical protein
MLDDAVAQSRLERRQKYVYRFLDTHSPPGTSESKPRALLSYFARRVSKVLMKIKPRVP